MKKGKNILSNLILFLCLIVFLFAAWKLWGYYKNYHDGEEEYETLREYTERLEDEENPEQEAGDICPITVDFDALKAINEDVVGWLYIPGTSINYPIVQGEDNEYYLKHTFEKKENFSGAIFMDVLCESDFSSDNSIVYGHNLKTGAMFGELKRLYDKEYNEEADYQAHPYLWILTPDGEMEYEIFSAGEINVKQNENVYQIAFVSEEEYEEYLKSALKRSQYETKADVSSDAPILTLSTCTSDTEEGRFLVQAIQILAKNKKTK